LSFSRNLDEPGIGIPYGFLGHHLREDIGIDVGTA